MARGTQGPLAGTYSTFDGMIGDTRAVSSFPAVPIFQQPEEVFELVVQNDPASTNNVVVGNAFAQWIVLIPGASMTIPINDPNKVYVRAAAGNATINWMGMT